MQRPDHHASRFRLVLFIFLTVMTASQSSGQEVINGFAPRSYVAANGMTMPYRLFVPDSAARARPLPLIIYLHGGGGAGTDNLKQISGGNTLGTQTWTRADMQARYPSFVVAPQLDGDNQWSAPEIDDLAPYAQLVIELVAALSREFRLDQDRIYLMGQSRGGRGTWDLVSKRPALFAAAVPVCGEGNSSRVLAARGVPIWAFHGAKDDVIPVTGSRELVGALRSAASPIRYTEYPDAGHNVWTLAFVEKELPSWLFSQRRTRR
jgi:predicted peptidase